MDKNEFNELCASVTGREVQHDSIGRLIMANAFFERYNPYDDLNVMAEVVEKLLDNADTFYSGNLSKHTFDTIGVGIQTTRRNSAPALHAEINRKL